MVLTLLELGDRGDHVGSVARHGVGVQLRLAMLDPRSGSLCHECPQAEVVGLVGEVRQLLVDDAQFFTQLPQPDTDLAQSTLDEPHGAQCTGGRQTTRGTLVVPARQTRTVSEDAPGTRMDDWGIASGFHDVHGDWIPAAPSTVTALRAAMGDPIEGPPLWFVAHGEEHRLLGPCRLELDDGTDVGEIDRLTGGVPIGYHRLTPIDGGPATRLIVHPVRCPAPPLAWGVAAQVYALWSERSAGIGDLGDVARLAARVATAGGRIVQLSPLHAPAPTFPQESSPYYPSSRRALSPLLIPVDASTPRPDPARLIDRDAVWSAKREALEAQFAGSRHDPDWREWARHQEPSLASVARWNTIADDFGSDWTSWPASLRHPADPTFDRRAAADDAVRERFEFHVWCQWRARQALDAATRSGVGLVADLAVGFSPAGADAWEFQDHLALGARIGAPPDVFNPTGQDWGLPPFVPHRLRAAAYEPLVATLRACLVGMAGIRIDHVMGLMRQYWIPPGGSPRDGAYVHLHAHEIMAIIALEATRAGAFVIGEDLGTVEHSMRDAMTAWGMLGTRVVLFEDAPPSQYPEMSLATATTHDLPTLAALLNGSADERLAERVLRLVGETPNNTRLDPVDAIAQVHDALLGSPARLRLLTTDDLCAATEQPNHPGTVVASNWSRTLPLAVDDIPLPDAAH
jgi:4-alpha-glucanotransferase